MSIISPISRPITGASGGVAYDQQNNVGGFAQLQINGVDLTAYFEVGNFIYYFVNIGSAEFKGIITASSFSGGNTLINTDQALAAGTGE